jgi:serine/threonine-protein kinase RIO1
MNEYKLFLDDENFLEPAVTENETPDQYTPDKKFHNELKQSALNGFKYRTGKETNIYIAWSEKEKRVKPYYNCCK